MQITLERLPSGWTVRSGNKITPHLTGQEALWAVAYLLGTADCSYFAENRKPTAPAQPGEKDMTAAKVSADAALTQRLNSVLGKPGRMEQKQ